MGKVPARQIRDGGNGSPVAAELQRETLTHDAFRLPTQEKNRKMGSGKLKLTVSEEANEKCSHPKRKRVTDPETQDIYCTKCGHRVSKCEPDPRIVAAVTNWITADVPVMAEGEEAVVFEGDGELEDLDSEPSLAVAAEKFNRTPTNAAVFRNNLGSTSKRNANEEVNKNEPSHVRVVASVYGSPSRKIRPLQRLTQTCPNCLTQQAVPVFGETIRCVKPGCPTELGHFVLRWLPFTPKPDDDENNGHERERPDPLAELAVELSSPNAISAAYQFLAIHANGHEAPTVHNRFSADLCTMKMWDPPEDDPTVKRAKEIFRKKVLELGISDADAHFLARRFFKGVREYGKNFDKDLEDLLESILEGEGIASPNGNRHKQN